MIVLDTFGIQPDPWVITFNHGDHQSYLRFYKDGRCEFEGDADAAATQFFEAVAKNYFIIFKNELRRNLTAEEQSILDRALRASSEPIEEQGS